MHLAHSLLVKLNGRRMGPVVGHEVVFEFVHGAVEVIQLLFTYDWEVEHWLGEWIVDDGGLLVKQLSLFGYFAFTSHATRAG